MKRRGFTLIEIIIVVCLIVIICGPFLALTASIYRQFKSLTMAAAMKTECDQAGYDILRLAAAGGAWKLDTDNHGVTFSSGSRVHFTAGVLTVVEGGRSRRLPLPHLYDCCLVRDGSSLLVAVSVRGPERPGGGPVETHGMYRFPVVEVAK